MWFGFPEGTEAISIAQQNFGVEARDKGGRGYFRAPDHFAPIITGLRGFSATEPPEGTDLEDLPKPDPLRDGAIEEMAKRVAVFESQISDLRTTVSQRDAELGAALHERDGLRLKVHELQAQIEELTEKNADLEEALPVKRK